MNGIVSGGWNFVIAAYGVTAFILVAYTINTLGALRASIAKRDSKPSTSKGNPS